MNRCVRHLEQISAARLACYMAGLFVLVHAAYWTAGVRFDLNPLSHFWQYLDPELLRSWPLESVFYLHIQPPLYNLLLGLVLRGFPGHEQAVFQALYVGAGFALYLLTFRLMRFLDVRRTIALAFSTWFMASPSFVLYEHWLFYTFPLALLLAAAAWLLARWLRTGKGWILAGYFATLAILCGTRSLFQFVHYLALFLPLLWIRRDRRRSAVLAALVPGLLIAALYGKNLLLFGRATTSTWLGMNLWGVVTRDLPAGELAAMVERGELSPVSAIDRFTLFTSYPAEYQAVEDYADVPALRQVIKSTGTINYNHAAYIRISDSYLRDAIYIAVHRPDAFLIAVVKGWFNYFRSSSDYVFLTENRNRVAAWADGWDLLFYGWVPYDLTRVSELPLHGGSSRYVYLFLLVGLPLLVGNGLAAALGSRNGRRISGDQRWLLLFLCFNILYVALLGNLMEVGENNRFRFMTDPFYVVLAALLAQDKIVPWLRFRLQRRRAR